MLRDMLSSFIFTETMLSFTEYASEKRILELLVKERVKVALKGIMANLGL